MSWLLDTDVLSQPPKTKPNQRVLRWLEEQRSQVYTSAIVVAQLAHWVQTKEGKTRAELELWLRRLLDAMEGRIYGFNVGVALVWGEFQHRLATAGQRMPLEDSYIAATAIRYGLTIVTGNSRHFRRLDLKVFDPFKELRDSRNSASSK
jgi:predicted nucleic acid-binding protein